MIVKIGCPECDTEGSFSLLESNYQGPYRCWKCRGLFTISLEDNELKSCKAFSQEEFDRQQEVEDLRAKCKRK